MKDLIFEIGTEEMPARAVDEGIDSLKEKAPKAFEAARMAFESVEVFGSPRRLALLVRSLSESQSKMVEEIKGPPAKVALDGNGAFTQAAYGFAKSQRVDEKQLTIKETENGSYLFATIERSGGETKGLLPGILLDLLQGINFSKSMRWGRSQIRFSRPIKWLLAVFGSDLIPLELDNIPVSDSSYGHRFLHPGPIRIDDPANYLDLLRSGFVMADQQERRNVIEKGINRLANERKWAAKDPSDVISEVVHLTEWPTAVLGSFDNSFLDVPKEVLITAMQSHQRYFPLEKRGGSLAPAFITIHNGDPCHSEAIARGNERVLSARLSDAKFFFEEDKKTGLNKMAEKLKNVIFLEELGTLYNKSQRLPRLAATVACALNLSGKAKKIAMRAAVLCKADLVSDVVVEFPILQGVMGQIYARLQNEEENVPEAIFEHYLPRFSGDVLPQTDAGVILSLADKLDNITGLISVGLIPSGSEDPYALRRQALGIIILLISRNYSVDLSSMMKAALHNFEKANREMVESQAKELFDGRMRQLLSAEGIRYDLIEAVMDIGSTNYLDVYKRAVALKDSLESSQLSELFVASERCRNLSRGVTPGSIDPNLIEEGAEKDLFVYFDRVSKTIEVPMAEGNYHECLILLSSLKKPIDRYFDDVLVMVKDDALRENRLRLLKAISLLFDKIASFEKIVEMEG